MFDIYNALKYAPKGLKLYSPFLGEVEFDRVEDGFIIIQSKSNGIYYKFNKYGNPHSIITSETELMYDMLFPLNGSECMLFPSKEYKEWICDSVRCWQSILFPQCIGSVLVDNDNLKFIVGSDKMYSGLDKDGYNDMSFFNFFYRNARFATEQETQELFRDIEKQNRFWNKETNRIEKKETEKHTITETSQNVEDCNTIKMISFHKGSEMVDKIEDGFFRVVWNFENDEDRPLESDNAMYIIDDEFVSGVKGIIHKVKRIKE